MDAQNDDEFAKAENNKYSRKLLEYLYNTVGDLVLQHESTAPHVPGRYITVVPPYFKDAFGARMPGYTGYSVATDGGEVTVFFSDSITNIVVYRVSN